MKMLSLTIPCVATAVEQLIPNEMTMAERIGDKQLPEAYCRLMALLAEALMPTENAAISNEARMSQICGLCLRTSGKEVSVNCFVLALLGEAVRKMSHYLEQDILRPSERLPIFLKRFMNIPRAPRAYSANIANLRQQLPSVDHQDSPLAQILLKVFEQYSKLNITRSDLGKIAAQCIDPSPGLLSVKWVILFSFDLPGL